MRSNLIYGAIAPVQNRYMLCQLVSKATRKFPAELRLAGAMALMGLPFLLLIGANGLAAIAAVIVIFVIVIAVNQITPFTPKLLR